MSTKSSEVNTLGFKADGTPLATEIWKIITKRNRLKNGLGSVSPLTRPFVMVETVHSESFRCGATLPFSCWHVQQGECIFGEAHLPIGITREWRSGVRCSSCPWLEKLANSPSTPPHGLSIKSSTYAKATVAVQVQ